MVADDKKDDIFGFEQAQAEYTIVKRAILHSFYEADEYLKAYSATGSEEQLVNFMAATLSLYRKVRPKIQYIAKLNKYWSKDKKSKAEKYRSLYELDKYLLISVHHMMKTSGNEDKNKAASEIIGSYLLMSDALEELGVSKITTESVSQEYALVDGAV